MNIKLRDFTAEDIPKKVDWVNDPSNNAFLHYDLPLEIEKTSKWFASAIKRSDRYDAVITVDEVPVGLIGLLNIDSKNRKAEFYILMGESAYKGKGIATKAGNLLLQDAFVARGLNRVYLYTETENIPAQRLFKKLGFVREGKLHDDLIYCGRYVERFLYAISKEQFISDGFVTPISFLETVEQNRIYIKRDDLFPYSFGGNKGRKAVNFFCEIDSGKFDCVVTYGSGSSNHCRVIANMAAERGMECYIISPEEASEKTYNTLLMKAFGAKITICPTEEVHETIEAVMEQLKSAGRNPYFIPGGGHGNLGTQAYVDCFREIKHYEKEKHMQFDYIFHASGTGTTQAGLICGTLIEKDPVQVIGISIARKKPYGREVVLDSVKAYLASIHVNRFADQIDRATIFEDAYCLGGYGKSNGTVNAVIKTMMIKHGIPMDGTYVGKAYAGMLAYIKKYKIFDKNILFIHTGGTPLFFNELENWQ